jgi:hypothetical protein
VPSLAMQWSKSSRVASAERWVIWALMMPLGSAFHD